MDESCESNFHIVWETSLGHRWRLCKQSSNPVDCFVDEFEELQFGALFSFGPYFDEPDLSIRFLNIESNLTKVCVHHIIK